MAEGNNYQERTTELLRDLPDYVENFINRYSGSNKDATMYEYCRDVHIFMEYLINYIPDLCDKQIKEISYADLAQILPEDIDNFLNVLRQTKDQRFKDKNNFKVKQKKVSEATLKRKRATISAFYSYLMNNGKVPKNPVFASKAIEIPKKKLVYLTIDQQKQLMHAVLYGIGLSKNELKYHEFYALRDAAMFMLLLDTGLRVSEMTNSDLMDYDLQNGKVLVTRKGGDQDIVFYSDECAGYLREYFDSQIAKYPLMPKSDIPAFTTIAGERLGVRAVEKLVKKYVKAALPGLENKISPHKLRSSFAMSFYDANNNNILLLQKRLHHKSVNTTNIYAQATEKDVENSRNVLQAYREEH